MAEDAGPFQHDAATITAWVKAAAPDDQLRYARAERLLPSAAGPALVRALIDKGLVRSHRVPAGNGLSDYLIVRRADGVRGCCARDAAPARIAGVQPIAADDEAMEVLKVLRRAAREGRPCPSNREIARLARLSDGERARYRMRTLREQGVIRVTPSAAEPRRIVTIVANGLSTGVVG